MSNTVYPAGTCNLFPASPANHVLYFSRMPQLSFVIQSADLPGITATAGRIGHPGMAMRVAADRVNYDPMSVTFLVDETYRTHRELHRWISGVTGGEDRTVLTQQFIEEQSQYQWVNTNPPTLNEAASTHAGLTILNGSKVPILRVLFYNVHLTNLGPLRMDITVPDTNIPMTSTATFEYDFYSFMEIR